MAFFGLFGSRKTAQQVRCKKSNGNTYAIVGEAAHQNKLLAIAGGYKQEYGVKIDIEATLEPEPTNHHDINAVAVIINKKRVGYLKKEHAPVFIKFLNENKVDSGLCGGRIVGGRDDGEGNEGHFGVKLSLSWPPKKI